MMIETKTINSNTALKKPDWLPSRRSCGCPEGHLNCLPKPLWLENQVPIWKSKCVDGYVNGAASRVRMHATNDRSESSTTHPATFPFDLAEHVIRNYSHPGETVLDPFCGSGTALVAAKLTGRNAIGLDLKSTYAAQAATALDNLATCIPSGGHHWVACCDARVIDRVLPPHSIDLVFTSPPYWDMLKQRPARRNRKRGKYLKQNYSADPHDLSNALSLPEYIGALRTVFRALRSILKKNARCVINIGDYRRQGRFIPLHAKCIELFEALGYTLENILFWDRRAEYSVGVFGYPYRFMASNGMVEYLLEFKTTCM